MLHAAKTCMGRSKVSRHAPECISHKRNLPVSCRMSADEHDYPLGTRVAFADSQATVSDGTPGAAEGTVNGPPLRDDDTGAITHIRVFAERDNGREATTIIVAAGNILGEVEQ